MSVSALIGLDEVLVVITTGDPVVYSNSEQP
jgi:hypothetical protein